MRTRYLLAVLVSLWGGLSAKPVLAQFPLEVGAGMDFSVALMRSRAYDFPEATDEQGAVSLEGAYGYSIYLATFPYEGWGWRAEVSSGVGGDPGRYSPNAADFLDGELYGRARLEVVYVAADWTSVGFGASFAQSGATILDYGGPNRYSVDGNRDIVGIHGSWSQYSRWCTVTFRADLTAVAGWGRSVMRSERPPAHGKYSEWTLGPSVQVTVPFNRAMWVKGLRGQRVIYSPRG